MKLFFITILSLFIFSGVAFSQTTSTTPVSKDSLHYCKTGTFRYVGMLSDMEIKRTKSTQIEYNYNKTNLIKMKVKWAADDEYWLTYISSKGTPIQDKKSVMKVKIIKAGKNGYTCHYSQDGHEGECSFSREQ